MYRIASRIVNRLYTTAVAFPLYDYFDCFAKWIQVDKKSRKPSIPFYHLIALDFMRKYKNYNLTTAL